MSDWPSSSPQLFKPFLDLNPGVVVDVAMLTVRGVDSQEGEQVAGQRLKVQPPHPYVRRRDT